MDEGFHTCSAKLLRAEEKVAWLRDGDEINVRPLSLRTAAADVSSPIDLITEISSCGAWDQKEEEVEVDPIISSLTTVSTTPTATGKKHYASNGDASNSSFSFPLKNEIERERDKCVSEVVAAQAVWLSSLAEYTDVSVIYRSTCC